MASKIVISNPISGLKLSSVVPAEMTGEGKDRELTNMDLVLKLHYIKAIYYFRSEAVQGLTIDDLKGPMFRLLTSYNAASGRIRRREKTGRPFIKCNDSGVRVVEGSCDKTVEEWLGLDDKVLDQDHEHVSIGAGNSTDDEFCLAHEGVLGPDLGFSPLVHVQFTKFKCGGVAVGLTWAHVLGDPISASAFVYAWAQILQGHMPPKSLREPSPQMSGHRPSTQRKPFFVKRVDPIGEHWLTTNNRKTKTHSFHLTPKQLKSILADAVAGPTQKAEMSCFHVLSAIIWKSLSKTREDLGSQIVTICTVNTQNREHEVPSNQVVFGTVQADFPVAKCDPYELAALIADKQEEENGLIEEMTDGENGILDYMAYGTTLTFVNMEGANVYGLELKGHKPAFVNYNISGVGEGGVVVVLPGPGGGRTLTVTLPEEQLMELKHELEREWNIA